MSLSSEKKLFVPKFFFSLGVLIAAYWGYVVYKDYGYYFIPYAQRPLHQRHDLLRSSGPLGLQFGVLSAILMFVNLTYLIRKSLLNITWLGELRSWMSFHVLTGLTAGLLVLLHSGFLLRSSMGGLSFAAMMIVIVTGLIGRFIYTHTPRSIQGTELEIEDIRRGLESYRAKLEALGMPPDFFRETFTVPIIRGREGSIFSALKALIVGNFELNRDFARLRRMLGSNPRLAAEQSKILPLAKNYFQELQWLDRYYELRALMRGWRFYHRWLAIVLLAAVIFHIFIAIQIGHVRFDEILKLHPLW